ncbi:class I SAM-dependent methyltransferase [Ignavibacteriales bacterium]
MKKIYKNLIDAVVKITTSTILENRHADGVINYVLKTNPKWGARDRKFIGESSYDIIRHLRHLSYAASTGTQTEEQIRKVVMAYLFINRLIDEPMLEGSGLKKEKLLQRYEEGKQIRKIRESVPDWLDELGEQELGARWEKELVALNKQAEVIIRVNSLKTNKRYLTEKFAEQNISVKENATYPDALILEERKNIFLTDEFKKGYFEIQDASSQAVAYFAGVKPGMRVIDACAGAGGKSLHMAAQMKNKGKILSLDVEEKKLFELKKRAKRGGVSIIEPRLIDSSKVIKRLADSADVVLLDVPCSGLGVLRRNPDAKWKLKKERIEELIKIQSEILSSYSSMVKKGGLLVFVTCSILPSENENQIKQFLSNHGDSFELLESKSVSPSESGFDGFFMAKLKRK